MIITMLIILYHCFSSQGFSLDFFLFVDLHCEHCPRDVCEIAEGEPYVSVCSKCSGNLYTKMMDVCRNTTDQTFSVEKKSKMSASDQADLATEVGAVPIAVSAIFVVIVSFIWYRRVYRWRLLKEEKKRNTIENSSEASWGEVQVTAYEEQESTGNFVPQNSVPEDPKQIPPNILSPNSLNPDETEDIPQDTHGTVDQGTVQNQQLEPPTQSPGETCPVQPIRRGPEEDTSIETHTEPGFAVFDGLEAEGDGLVPPLQASPSADHERITIPFQESLEETRMRKTNGDVAGQPGPDMKENKCPRQATPSISAQKVSNSRKEKDYRQVSHHNTNQSEARNRGSEPPTHCALFRSPHVIEMKPEEFAKRNVEMWRQTIAGCECLFPISFVVRIMFVSLNKNLCINC